MEIEKKYLIHRERIPLERYPYVTIEQGYICTDPVVRIRKKDDSYYLTCKSSGFMIRKEFEEPISQEQYMKLRSKVEHHLISKRRYLIPLWDDLVAEVDVFQGALEGLVMAEVEFPSEEKAHSFHGPDWFSKEVTTNPLFHNSHLCQEEDVCFLNGVE